MSLVAKKCFWTPASSLAILLLLALSIPVGCQKSDDKQTAAPADKEGGKTPETLAQPQGNASGKQPAEDSEAMRVLRQMISAYRSAKSYSDEGTVRMIIDTPRGKTDDKANLSVVLERPGRAHLKLYQSDVVCDGENIQAAISELPGQYRSKPITGELKLEDMFFDPVLVQVMSQGQAGLSLPLVMFLGKEDMMAAVLREAEPPVLDKSDDIDGKPCYRVKLRRPDGTMILWIDQATYALRRINMPIDGFFKSLREQAPVTSVSVTAEFTNATLDGKIGPEAFVFELPAKAELVNFFVPPNPAQLLGKPVPDIKFTDLDGKPVAIADFAGKVVVLEFWATWCGPCRKSLPNLATTAKQYADKENVVFLAVSVDAPQIEDAELKTAMEKMDADLPVLRDLDQSLPRELRAVEIPILFIIDAKGTLQYFEFIRDPVLAATLPDKIDKVLAEEDIFEPLVTSYRDGISRYEAEMERIAKGGKTEETSEQDRELPRSDIAPASEPKRLKLSSLWTCKDVKAPGNILIVSDKGQSPRILVVEALKGAVELDADGKIAAAKKFKLEENEVVSALRTAAGADGKRYYAAFASAQQRFHLFDDKWRPILSYPENALENKHDGIADVELGDLNNDGEIEAYVGYWGVVGVQAVSLDGTRTASNRKISDVVRCAISGPDQDGQRGLFCANRRGNLAILDSELQPISELSVQGKLLTWIVSAQLTGDPNLNWCALCSPRLGENIALGIDLDGREVWNYPMPEGVHPQPIEPIIAGDLGGKAGVWLLPGCDGSIHIVDADGTLIDRFNYGKALCGLAAVMLDGQAVLLVSSPDGVEALRVDY